MMKRFLAALLCLMLLMPCGLAESSLTANLEDEDVLADFVPPELTDDELAQWAEWAGEGEEASDATAENAADLTAEEEALMAEISSMLDDTTADTEVDLDNLEPNPDLPDHVFNILLLGVDNRSVQLETGRADANIICSINLKDGSVKLTSFARDTAVVVPGYKSRKRLNTAFKFGSKNGDMAKGAELAMKTINRNFHMNVERYVVVNIHGLADIIEALGGVDMDLTKGEASAINYELHVKEPMDKVKRDRLEQKDGVQHLDGMEAVTYGRIRNLKGQNDINRNNRQRHLLEALFGKVMADMDLAKFMNLIETALPYGATNLTMEEMLTLGMAVIGGDAMKAVKDGGEFIGQMGVPMEKQYGYKKFDKDTLIYISDKRMQTTISAMQEFIYGESFEK